MPSAFPSFSPGPVLARTEVGTVRKATDPQDGQPVALLVVDPGVAGDPARRAALEQALAGWHRLSHPGVLALRRVVAEGAGIGLVMDPWDGAPLALFRPEETPLPQGADAWDASEHLLEVLSYAHAQGVAHGRLDANHVLLTGRAGAVSVRVWGFGLSAAIVGAERDDGNAANLVGLLLTGRSLAEGGGAGPAASVLQLAATPGGLSQVAEFLAALRQVRPAELSRATPAAATAAAAARPSRPRRPSGSELPPSLAAALAEDAGGGATRTPEVRVEKVVPAPAPQPAPDAVPEAEPSSEVPVLPEGAILPQSRPRRRRRGLRILLVAVLLALVGGGAVGGWLWWQHREEAEETLAPMADAARVAAAKVEAALGFRRKKGRRDAGTRRTDAAAAAADAGGQPPPAEPAAPPPPDIVTGTGGVELPGHALSPVGGPLGPPVPATEELPDSFFADDPEGAPAAPGTQPPPSPPPAVGHDRDQARRLNRLGLKAYRSGDLSDALALYEAALRADASYHKAHYNAACMYAVRGEIDPVVAHLVAYKRLSPKRVNLRRRVNKDRDFARMLGDPRFTEWLERQ